MSSEIESILERVLAGEVDAYQQIVRHYQQDVWRTVAFAMQDLAATEDLVQQAFVNAYFNLDKYKRGKDFRAWLKAIARNLVRNELRRSGREAKNLRHYRQWLEQRLENQAESNQAEQDLLDALKECRQRLSPAATQALELRYGRALAFQEIAGALGRTVTATRQLLARIRLMLRQCIQERGLLP